MHVVVRWQVLQLLATKFPLSKYDVYWTVHHLDN